MPADRAVISATRERDTTSIYRTAAGMEVAGSLALDATGRRQ
jgi:hypothetical protein